MIKTELIRMGKTMTFNCVVTAFYQFYRYNQIISIKLGGSCQRCIRPESIFIYYGPPPSNQCVGMSYHCLLPCADVPIKRCVAAELLLLYV